MNVRSAREVAAQLLLRRERGSQYTEDLLAEELPKISSPSDRGLVQELTYGVVRRQATLDWLIQRKTQAGRAQKLALRVVLRLGLYQLFWLERIPDHAAVNEAVTLAKSLGLGHQSGFVNAVLRGYLRERAETERLLEELKSQQPALGYSHPEWLFERWQGRWGAAKAAELMAWNNEPAKTFARVNRLRITPTQLLEFWRAEQVDCEAVQYDWAEPETVFALKSHPPLRELRSFREGCFYVQDPSTLLAPGVLDPRPGESVLDLCAAPGGKTTRLAEQMANQGAIIAEDFDPERLQRLRENCERLGITCVQARVTPDPSSLSDSDPRFDRVLLDAPCSNTGVLRRRIDLRWRIRSEEIRRLQKSQLDLLRRASDRVKPGGRMVYSTCSLEPEEDQEVIRSFLSERNDFVQESERELLPFVDGVDGAYVASLLRKGT